MDPIDTMISRILAEEGGFNNRAADRGGPTNCGISLRFAQQINLDLNGDGVVDEADIRLVTPQIAANVYRTYFYTQPGLAMLPTQIQAEVFDIAVNSGANRAIALLQQSLNVLDGKGIAPDGIIGPVTIQRCNMIIASVGFPKLEDTLVDTREVFYQHIVSLDPAERVFLLGWTRRAEGFRV